MKAMVHGSPILTGEGSIADDALVMLEVWISPHRSVTSRWKGSWKGFGVSLMFFYN